MKKESGKPSLFLSVTVLAVIAVVLTAGIIAGVPTIPLLVVNIFLVLIDLDSCWLLGSWGLRVYENLAEGRPAETSLVCGDTGNIYLRSGWEEDAHYTYLHCGPLGSSHGHGDRSADSCGAAPPPLPAPLRWAHTSPLSRYRRGNPTV